MDGITVLSRTSGGVTLMSRSNETQLSEAAALSLIEDICVLLRVHKTGRLPKEVKVQE